MKILTNIKFSSGGVMNIEPIDLNLSFVIYLFHNI